MLLLVGLAVIGVPLVLALKTVVRIVRRLGAVDAGAVGRAVAGQPELDLAKLADRLEAEASGSLAQRLVSLAVRPAPEWSHANLEVAMSEEVADLERSILADVRVPRVAASLATTGGLLAAALVMREGLSIVVPEDHDPVPIYYAVIERGLTLAAIAVFGGLVCAALHRAAQAQRTARLRELDELVIALGDRLFRTPDAEGDVNSLHR